MTRITLAGAAAAALAALAVGGCGKAAPGTGSTESTAAKDLTTMTTAATKDVDKVTWATYRDIGTLDPIQAFDYPENTVVTALCESVLRQAADGTIGPGLATLTRPDAKTIALKVRSGVTFWDGKPVTAEDVAFSLQRAASLKSGSFYPAVFSRVASIEPSGADTVTIKLTQPDYWLDGELSQMPGVVVEKAFAESAGKQFGTPSGQTMCTGAFKVKSWKPGAELVAERNPDYWDGENAAKVGEIAFKGVPDESSLTSGLLTGGIDGSYPQALGSLPQLESNDNVTVTHGPSFASDAIVISNLKGTLKDVRVRQALSLALDRAGYISQTYHDGAQLPRTLANPGTWGYGKDVFQKDWDGLAEPKQDLAKAKQLIKDAGAEGKPVVLGMTTEVSNLNSVSNVFREAGNAIGLKVTFKAVSAQNFINFFTDPKAREGIDGFPTVNYPDYADPAAFYNTFVMADGSQNYAGFADAQITKEMNAARAEADPDARAGHVVAAGDRIKELLPWLPVAAPDSVQVTTSNLTGAPPSFVYMGGPWANRLGGK